MRMKPASSTRSGACVSMAVASAASNASRDACARWSTTAVAMPWARANCRPAASARLASTAATRAGQCSCAQARTMASMLEPRPEIRMTMRWLAMEARQCTSAKMSACPRHATRHATPRPLRHAPHRLDAPGPLPRCIEELGAPARRLRLLLLRRRLARADHALRGARGHREDGLRHGGRLAGGWPRSREEHHLHPEPAARACRAVHAAGDGHAAGLARARADLQGSDREAEGPRPRDLR